MLLVRDREAILFAQRDNDLHEHCIGDAAPKLAVERIDRGLAQRKAIDVVAFTSSADSNSVPFTASAY